jgi:hypothetical protein
VLSATQELRVQQKKIVLIREWQAVWIPLSILPDEQNQKGSSANTEEESGCITSGQDSALNLLGRINLVEEPSSGENEQFYLCWDEDGTHPHFLLNVKVRSPPVHGRHYQELTGGLPAWLPCSQVFQLAPCTDSELPTLSSALHWLDLQRMIQCHQTYKGWSSVINTALLWENTFLVPNGMRKE